MNGREHAAIMPLASSAWKETGTSNNNGTHIQTITYKHTLSVWKRGKLMEGKLTDKTYESCRRI